MHAIVALLTFCCHNASAQQTIEPLPLIGVNFAGASFVAEKLPGRIGWDYFYPDIAGIGYFAGKGANVVRLCVLWERLQTRLGSDQNESEMKQIDAVIAEAHSKGIRVLLDIHNYAAFEDSRIGSDKVSVQDFADLWRRIAARYRDDHSVIFGLMNEPVQLATETWLDAANAAIEAIRRVLQFMQDNRDVWIGWTYWAAGPWAKDYFTNIEPDGGADRPQMAVLEKFMAAGRRN